MSQKFEDSYPLSVQGGFTTALPVVLSGTAATLAVGGTLAVTGASTLTGVATFTAAPVFTAAPSGPIKQNVLASSGNTTITAATSGSVRLFDSASTTAYVLPAPVVGLYYDFLWTALETGGQAHSITTDAGTTYCVGYVTVFSDVNITPSATLGPKGFAGAAADTYVKITMNGTTTGGGIGTWLRFTCVSATAWNVSGIVRSPSGTIATPFSV